MGHRERGVSRAVETLSGREMLSAAAFAKFIGVSREAVRAKHTEKGCGGAGGCVRKANQTFTMRASSEPLSQNKHLIRWVEKMAELCTPESIHWVDGSEEEDTKLCAQLVKIGTFIKLNEELWPGCYYARSDPPDVPRAEPRTFICSLSKN